MQQIILASTSPRRKELLQATGIPFRAVAPYFEEDMSVALSPRRLVRLFALEKARSVAKRFPRALIIGGDTVVVHKGKVLGKPHRVSLARQMLTQVSGSTHVVMSAVAVVDAASGKTKSRIIETKLRFRRLTVKEINSYIQTKEPLSYAGAYAVQHGAKSFVQEIHGDYTNVIGMPMVPLLSMLKKFGVTRR